MSWQCKNVEAANGANSDTTANFGNTPTKGNNFVLKFEKRSASKMLSEHEKFSYAAMNSKHMGKKDLSKPRIRK